MVLSDNKSAGLIAIAKNDRGVKAGRLLKHLGLPRELAATEASSNS